MSRGKRTAQKTSFARTPGGVMLIVVACLVIVCAIIFAALALSALKYDKIYPGVHWGDEDLGGLTVAEAEKVIEKNMDITGGIEDMSFSVDGEEFTIYAEDIVSSVGADELAQAAYDVGRDDGIMQKIRRVRGHGEDEFLLLDAVLDEAYIEQFITESLAPYNVEKIDASWKLNDKTLTLTAGRDGSFVNTDAAVKGVLQKYVDGDYTPLKLEAEEQQAVSFELDDVYAQLCSAAVDAHYDAEKREVVEGKEGYGFELEDVKTRFAALAPGETMDVLLSVVPPERGVEEVEAWLYENLLYDCTTNLEYNPDRTNNVSLASQAINGTVVAPGETFSFDGTVGQRTAERGYKKANVYVGGATVGEIGGGICQVASTMYNCVLYSNLEVVERREHQFLVTYVQPGLDATIYWGSSDFKWKNDTEYPILIKAWVDGGQLTVQFWGQTDEPFRVEMISETLSSNPYATVYEDAEGNSVELDESKTIVSKNMKQSGYTGYAVRVTRNVYDGSDNLISSTLESNSNYSRRDKIYTIVYAEAEAPEEPTTPEEPVQEPPTTPEEPTVPEEPAAPVDTPIETPIETPAETPNETPAETSGEIPANTGDAA